MYSYHIDLKQHFLSYFKYSNSLLNWEVAFPKYCFTVDKINQGVVENREWGEEINKTSDTIKLWGEHVFSK